MFHGSSIAHWQGVMACRSIGIGAEPFHVRPAQTIHTNAITQGVSIMSRYRMPVEIAAHDARSEEHTSELQSHVNLVCRLLLEKKKKKQNKLVFIKKKNKK